jgi:hypothetical protein
LFPFSQGKDVFHTVSIDGFLTKVDEILLSEGNDVGDVFGPFNCEGLWDGVFHVKAEDLDDEVFVDLASGLGTCGDHRIA